MTIPIGLQLYSIKEDTSEDFLGTLRKVGEIGYDGVEFAGYFGVSAHRLRQVLAESGLKAAGSHLGMQILKDDIDSNIEYAKAIDCPALICPGFRVKAETEDFFKEIADSFNQFGEKCKEAGLTFVYHLHGHEFVDVGGKTGMDVILSETVPSLVSFEPDTYWVERAGLNALQFYLDNKDRCTYIHFKDSQDRNEWHDTEIGDGIIDVTGIIKATDPSVVKWYIVEQEAYKIPRMESIAISLKNLQNLS